MVVDRTESTWHSVTNGVPQGSVLGPVVFINDLATGVKSGLAKFADDTRLWGRVSKLEERLVIQADLDRLRKCADKNPMTFNMEKCKVLHLRGKKTRIMLIGLAVLRLLAPWRKRTWGS